ncbi:MAG: glycosyltransferase family 39 protein [Solirubrobacteraceae bacterium]
MSHWVVLAGLSVLVLVSLWLRVRSLNFHLWIDEGLSVGISSHHLSQIPALMRQDGSPPLYYLLLHVWMGVRGRSEVATHELSLIFALLTIPVAYWAGASLFDRRTGVVCAVLAAGAPYLTVYGQETRMYSLLGLLALVVAASFVHAFVRRRRRYLPVFVVSLAAALYTHNWALFLGLMSAAAFLLCVRESRGERSLWRDGALAFGGVALLYAPWVPTVIYQARHTGAPWSLPPVVWSLSQGMYSVVGGRGVAIALLLGAGTGLLALRAHGSAPGWVRLATACLLVLGLGTLLTAWVGAKVTSAWAPRYLAVVVGPLIVLFGLGLARAGRLGLVALALTVCFWVLDPMPRSLDTKSNVASAIAKVRPQLDPGALVLSTQPEEVPTVAYYLNRVSRYGSPLGRVADPGIVDWRDALGRLKRSSVKSTLMPMINSLKPGERVALVVSLSLPKTPLWMKLINRASDQWSSALRRDPALERISTSAAHSGAAGVPVRVTVYLRRDRPIPAISGGSR